MFPGFNKLPPKAASSFQAPMEEPMEDESMETEEHEAEEVEAVTISPEAVCYRDEQQVCGNCMYMEASGECQPLRMTVDAGAGCNLFKQGGM